ncbi:acetyl-CoA carboxylase, carboxyltransferase subunit beta [Chitinispirillales bacterium ANBcel5]|uniref:acetyl-CoA carboxylase, carboxyltransferase subunit beta n=1 Tax=Cellulosispirillum alkaliphilum TaxID=3039283 RepID=UPI002A5510E6|nr:acetyl-CoA carboxylase, carboxyltransferase subunit beta [Chitinispirillales bacterium ANBcel5]
MPWFIKTRSTRDAKKKRRDEIWIRCKSCNAHIFKEDFSNNQNVCPKCNWHGKLTAYERIGITLDSGSFAEINETITPSDPLSFVDAKGSYKEKVELAREKTSLNESIVTGTGKISGIDVVVGVMDFRFLGGSLGSATGEKILLAANYAYDHRLPYIVFSASGGARMHEGILSLMQMAKTCAGVARLDEKRLPYISVLTDPTTGGVSASYAMVGDLNLAEPGALVGFAGRRVIEQTIKQKLPENFQTSEFVQEHGFIDKVVHRKDMKTTLHKILSFYNR